jgi:uncharacterized membrane protein YcaP (DUF421 family)
MKPLKVIRYIFGILSLVSIIGLACLITGVIEQKTSVFEMLLTLILFVIWVVLSTIIKSAELRNKLGARI